MDTDQIVPGLHWGIKSSFVDYVRRMPDGKASVSGGAVPVEGDVLVFAPDPEVTGPGRFWAFRGDVRFGGHFGMLFVRIANPWITFSGTTAMLSVEDPYQREDQPRLDLAELDLRVVADAPAGLEVWTANDVRLTTGATELFNDVYPAGEPLEPVTLVLPVVPDEVAPGEVAPDEVAPDEVAGPGA